MIWSHTTCTILECKPGVELDQGYVLTFPAKAQGEITVTNGPNEVATGWKLTGSDGYDAYLSHGGKPYKVTKKGTEYRCEPSGGGLLAPLSAAGLGIVVGTSIGALLGLPLAGAVAVAAATALVQLTLALLFLRPLSEGTTWTARDGNGLLDKAAPTPG